MCETSLRRIFIPPFQQLKEFRGHLAIWNCQLLNQYGLVVGWDCATANVPDQTFQWLIRQVDGRMIVLMRHDSACCIATQVDGKSEDLPEVSRLT